jgi:glycosyltransferase involved in cell wall biosynthesis
MRCGIPIISGNKTSLPEVLGDTGILVDPFSVEEIANSMLQLATNEKLQQELSTKAIERSKLFSWDFSAEKVWEVIVGYKD